MNKLKAIWDKINGCKTVIGSTIIVFVPYLNQFINEFVIGIWHRTPPAIMPQLIASLIWIGTALTTVGLVHKAVKYNADDTANPPASKPIL